MDRITENDLKRKIVYLNELMGYNISSYSVVDDIIKPNPNVYHLNIAYGGYALDQMMPTGTGVKQVFSRTTKRELYNQICAFIQGISL
jgi:hypothetical protein